MESRRFDYVVYGEDQKIAQEKFKEFFKQIEDYANSRLVESRPKSLMMTALEESYMWAGKALRDEAIFRNENIPHSEDRTNG